MVQRREVERASRASDMVFVLRFRILSHPLLDTLYNYFVCDGGGSKDLADAIFVTLNTQLFPLTSWVI